MNQYFFRLNLSYQSFAQHYTKPGVNVQVMTEQGLRLQLPAIRLRPYLSQLGLKGRFCLTTNNKNQFVSLELLQN